MAAENEKIRAETSDPGLQGLSLGLEIDGIQLQESLGSSEYRASFKGWAVEDANFVSIKFFRAPQDPNSDQFLEQVIAEINARNSIETDGVLRISNFGVFKDAIYVVTDWLEGGSLSARMVNRDDDLVSRVDKLAAGLCGVLQKMHSASIVHGNLKPSNIIFDDRDQPILTDFVLPSLRRPPNGNATPAKYIAPELQEPPAELAPVNDVFSVGAILYEILTGRRFLYSTFELPTRIDATVAAAWDRIVERATRLGPARRYQNADELVAELPALSQPSGPLMLHCPECGEETPADSLTCMQCKADLKDLFDECIQCHKLTPMLHPACIHCGSHASQVERKKPKQASKSGVLRAEALALEETGDYEQALARMHEMTKNQGEPFLQSKEQAQEVIDRLRETISQEFSRRLTEVKRDLDTGAVSRALDLLDAMPPEDPRTKELAEQCMQKTKAAQEALEGSVDAALAGGDAEAKDLAARARQLWNDSKLVNAVVKIIPSIYQDARKRDLYRLLDLALEALSKDQFNVAREHLDTAIEIDRDDARVREVARTFKHERIERSFLCNVMEAKLLIVEGDVQDALNSLLEASRWLPGSSMERDQMSELMRALSHQQIELDHEEFEAQWNRLRPYGTSSPEAIQEKVDEDRPEHSSSVITNIDEETLKRPSGLVPVSAADVVPDEETPVRSRELTRGARSAAAKAPAATEKPHEKLRWYDLAIFLVVLGILIWALVYLFTSAERPKLPAPARKAVPAEIKNDVPAPDEKE